MSRMRILGIFFAVTLVFTAVHTLALYIESDIGDEAAYAPVHFLGGVCLGLFAMYIAHGLRARGVLFFVLAWVFAVGIAWELLEYALDFTMGYADTVFDLGLDVLGGFVAYKLIGEHSS